MLMGPAVFGVVAHAGVRSNGLNHRRTVRACSLSATARLGRAAEIAGGLALIGIGASILVDHLTA